MTNTVTFEESTTQIDVDFGEVADIGVAGYNSGYANGYSEGNTEGYNKGYHNGYEAGNIKGEENGYAKGEAAGYAEGYATGNSEGYNKGYHNGYESGYDKGEDAGEKTENERFWDIMQNYGAKMAGLCFFRSPAWNDENFKPKYTVYATAATFTDGVDNSTTGVRCGMTDLRPETVGVEIDWSLCNNFNGALIHTPVKYVGVIDMTNAQYASTMLYNAKQLEEVKKIILPTRAVSFGNLGFSAVSLREIRFEGELQGSVNFTAATNLTLESAKSILLHLKNFTGKGSEYSCTVSLHANTWVLLDADDTAPGGVTWREYVMDTLSWNI